MKKSNYFTVYCTLNTKEEKQFSSHIHAFYGTQKITLKIFNFYKTFHKSKKNPPDLKEANYRIFGHIAKSSNDLNKLRNGLSDLHIALKEFLVSKKIQTTDFEKEFLWMQILEEKELTHQSGLQSEKILKKLHQIEKPNIWYPFYELQVQHHLGFKNEPQKVSEKIKLTLDGMKSLDEFYIGMKLKYTVEINSMNALVALNHSMPLLPALMDHAANNSSSLSLLNKLYFLLNQLLIEKTISQFQELKQLLVDKVKILSTEERLTTLTYLLNFLALEIKKGKIELNSEVFDLYKFGLEAKILTNKGTIDPALFNNIVDVACYENQLNWATKFIESYQGLFPEKAQNQHVILANATIQFKKKDFSEVLNLLSIFEFTRIIHTLRAKIYICASFFELGEIDKLTNAINAFERFISRSTKLGESNRLAAQNFIKIIRTLSAKKLTATAIEKKINATKTLFFRFWLKDQLQKYKQL